MKRRIRLSESDLHNIIRESVEDVLVEARRKETPRQFNIDGVDYETTNQIKSGGAWHRGFRFQDHEKHNPEKLKSYRKRKDGYRYASSYAGHPGDLHNYLTSESMLHNTIKEAVKSVLSEGWEDDYNAAMDKQDYMNAKKEYDAKPFLKRMAARLTGKRPKDPNSDASLEDLLRKYPKSFNKEHGIGTRTDYPGGESFHSSMYAADEDGQPVLTATHYSDETGAAQQTRKKFNKDGGNTEWGISYPLSEFGVTMKDVPLYANDDAKRKYQNFKNHEVEISDVIKNRKRRKS